MPSPGGPAGASTAVSQDAGRETGAPPAARDADVTPWVVLRGGPGGKASSAPVCVRHGQRHAQAGVQGGVRFPGNPAASGRGQVSPRVRCVCSARNPTVSLRCPLRRASSARAAGGDFSETVILISSRLGFCATGEVCRTASWAVSRSSFVPGRKGFGETDSLRLKTDPRPHPRWSQPPYEGSGRGRTAGRGRRAGRWGPPAGAPRCGPMVGQGAGPLPTCPWVSLSL